MSEQNPTNSDELNTFSNKSKWGVISAVRSPLSLFAMVVLICNTVFGLAAAYMKDIEAFKYTIHMFLAIIGAFVMIAIWAPRALYHPRDLQELGDAISGERLPRVVVTIVLVGTMLVYMGYQMWKHANQ